MKFGVIVVREFEEFVDTHLIATISELTDQGCTPQNIVVRTVPKLHDVVIATQFFAEYTDVDGVIILAPQNRIMGTLSVMNGIVQIQIHWNMVVEIGGVECASNIVDMIVLQNEMEMEAPENRNQRIN
jgi:6,7-dimethyl-8-ribityllumazine synthase